MNETDIPMTLLLVNQTGYNDVTYCLNCSTTTLSGNVANKLAMSQELTEYKIGEVITRYSLIVLCFVGFVCNTLSFFVNRRRMRQSSPHYYMTHLAVWDCVFIFCRTFYHYRQQLNVNIGSFGCKAFNFFHTFSSHYSAWLLVAMTFERFMAVRFPFKMVESTAIQRAKSTTGFMAVIFVNVNLHYFWTMDMRIENSYAACRFKSPYHLFDHVWKWVDFALYSLIPLFVIIILNTLIVYNLGRRQKRSINTSRSRNTNRISSQQKTQRQITVMLLAVSSSFALLTAPLCVYDIFRSSIRNPMALSAVQLATMRLLASIFYCLCDLQHCINFILYFLTGKSFRKELREFYRKKILFGKEMNIALGRINSSAYSL